MFFGTRVFLARHRFDIIAALAIYACVMVFYAELAPLWTTLLVAFTCCLGCAYSMWWRKHRFFYKIRRLMRRNLRAERVQFPEELGTVALEECSHSMRAIFTDHMGRRTARLVVGTDFLDVFIYTAGEERRKHLGPLRNVAGETDVHQWYTRLLAASATTR